MSSIASPGVYVLEVPSAIQPIAGVGTSTAGFIGVVPNSLNYAKKIVVVAAELLGQGTGTKKNFDLAKYPVLSELGSFSIRIDGVPTDGTLENDASTSKAKASLLSAPASGAAVSIDYRYVSGIDTVVVETPLYKPVLCTNFTEFKKAFGDFSLDPDQSTLAHAVFGFFANGGTRCWVARVAEETAAEYQAALLEFEAIDEIAIVAAPGVSSDSIKNKVVEHCASMEDRVAVIDGVSEPSQVTVAAIKAGVSNSSYGALYYPWLVADDAATNITKVVPPSGHIAGVYARVDAQRGVHKAPANEALRGIAGLAHAVSKSQQDGLNLEGVNCIRQLNGAYRVWGARTIGGDANGEFKYINVRRVFNYLRESIDEGMQWVVFEPNTPGLWAKIVRNTTAFLTNVWRDGALFGTSPQEAFFVRCDAELNPPEIRDNGKVITEVGVAIVRPAEFVIFRLSQGVNQGK